MFYFRTVYTLLLLTTAFSGRVAAADEATVLKIISQPGKLVCQSNSNQLGDTTSKIELCVTGGNFSHDTYELNIDKKRILKGSDDEATKGLSSSYQGKEVSLVCVPQHEAPTDISPEKIAAYQDMMKISAEEAKQMVTLAETVETGRLCKARLGSDTLLEIQVLFEREE